MPRKSISVRFRLGRLTILACLAWWLVLPSSADAQQPCDITSWIVPGLWTGTLSETGSGSGTTQVPAIPLYVVPSGPVTYTVQESLVSTAPFYEVIGNGVPTEFYQTGGAFTLSVSDKLSGSLVGGGTFSVTSSPGGGLYNQAGFGGWMKFSIDPLTCSYTITFATSALLSNETTVLCPSGSGCQTLTTQLGAETFSSFWGPLILPQPQGANFLTQITRRLPSAGPPLTGNLTVSAEPNFVLLLGAAGTPVAQFNLSWSLVPPGQGCQVIPPVQRLGQCDGKPGHWGGESYAYHIDPAGTICHWGCALTSLSMSLNKYGVVQIPVLSSGVADDPGFLNNFMNFYSDYTNGDVLFGKAVTDVVQQEFTLLRNAYNLRFVDSPFGNPSSSDDLELAVCHGNQQLGRPDYQPLKDRPTPVVVQVTSQCSGANYGHYVLVTGELIDSNTGEKTFTIADPAGQGPNANAVNCPLNAQRTVQTFTTLDSYLTLDGQQNPFKIRGWVSDPLGDMSQLYVTVGDSADLLLTDPSGNRTGFDSGSGSDLREIPNSSHPEDRIDDDETGEIGYTLHTVSVFQPATGNYVVRVSSLKTGTFTLTLIPFASDRSQGSQLSLPGVAVSGSASTFQVRYSSTPGTTSTLIRVATYSTTLANIANSLQLGLIDNAGIANALSAKINAASDAAARGDSATASNVLNAFKNQVSAQTGKHIIGVAPQVLQEDADSLISQLP